MGRETVEFRLLCLPPKIMEWKEEYTKNTIAKVTLFDGSTKMINVEKIVYFNNLPLRIYGDGYKFKMDEEPFKIYRS